MKKLNEVIWEKREIFGDRGFLSINSTKSGVDGIRLKEGAIESIPYITRSENCNGVARFVADSNIEYGIDRGGCITVGLDTQTAFYQPCEFITGQNIQIITGNSVNMDSAHFYTTILRNQMKAKFNWGGNGATLGRMKRLEALFPISSINNDIDYNYMSEYIKLKKDLLLTTYHTYIEKQIQNLGNEKTMPSLKEKDWQPFAITKLFSSLVAGKGKGLNHIEKTEHGISYIGATNRNNGILCFVDGGEKTKKLQMPGNCIGFIKNGDGSAGYAIYKFEPFISTSDVIYGYAKWLNKYTGLFFVACQDMIEHKYGHGYKRNRQHLEGDKVMLPINANSEPDYEYMEQYAKNMMIRKYKQYLAYVGSEKE